jgi:hypothetical protein
MSRSSVCVLAAGHPGEHLYYSTRIPANACLAVPVAVELDEDERAELAKDAEDCARYESARDGEEW